MQVNTMMAAFALALAGFILWRCWSNVIAKNSRTLAARIPADGPDAMGEPAGLPQSKPWIVQPVPPTIEIKAARVRSRPATPTGEALPSPRATWSADADAELLRLMADGMAPADIADRLRRSEKAVLLRMPLLDCKA